MKRTIVYTISMMVVCFVCAAKEVIIQPEFNVGETFEYKVTTELRLR